MTAASCFFRGTRIDTPNGPAPVENLEIGDRVRISGGKTALVRFIGKKRLVNDSARWPREVEPVIIQKGAFGKDCPERDLWLSPEHAIYLNGLFFTAGELVNQESIVRLGESSIRTIDYYHVDLGFHNVVYAQNMQVESYGGANRSAFDNHREFTERYGEAACEAYAAFAPRAYALAGTTSRLGSKFGRRLPPFVYRMARPLGQPLYRRLYALDRIMASARARLPACPVGNSSRDTVLRQLQDRASAR